MARRKKNFVPSRKPSWNTSSMVEKFDIKAERSEAPNSGTEVLVAVRGMKPPELRAADKPLVVGRTVITSGGM